MKTTSQVTVKEKSGSFRKWLRTSVDLSFAPSVGMIVDTEAWGPRTVQRLTLGLGLQDKAPCLMVYLDDFPAESQQKAEELVKMALSHGWKEPSVND